mmetsp:Transcript_1250/g.3483  ORF Transcript_1250/g.3483 Transcript_1250/m.3483 type:complete len:223 (-) Transcript_1250:701-1369(-)
MRACAYPVERGCVFGESRGPRSISRHTMEMFHICSRTRAYLLLILKRQTNGGAGQDSFTTWTALQRTALSFAGKVFEHYMVRKTLVRLTRSVTTSSPCRSHHRSQKRLEGLHCTLCMQAGSQSHNQLRQLPARADKTTCSSETYLYIPERPLCLRCRRQLEPKHSGKKPRRTLLEERGLQGAGRRLGDYQRGIRAHRTSYRHIQQSLEDWSPRRSGAAGVAP